MPSFLPRALQILFEAWTNDIWSGPIALALPPIIPLQRMVPAVYNHAWRFSLRSGSEPTEQAADVYSEADREESAFAAVYVEIDEARRAHAGLMPGTASDSLLWAAFYVE